MNQKMISHKKVFLDPSEWLKKQYTYEKYDGKVPIDIKLSKLIKLMWQNGIRTTSCCQSVNIHYTNKYHNLKRAAWIKFYNLLDVKKFKILTKSMDKSKWCFNATHFYFPVKQAGLISQKLKVKNNAY